MSNKIGKERRRHFSIGDSMSFMLFFSLLLLYIKSALLLSLPPLLANPFTLGFHFLSFGGKCLL